MPYMLRCFQQGRAPQLRSWRRAMDWIYIDDVIDAFIRACLIENLQPGTIDIGTGKLTTIGEVASYVAREMGSELSAGRAETSDRPWETSPVADPTEAGRRLGWVPRMNLAAGIQRTVSWYRGQAERKGEP